MEKKRRDAEGIKNAKHEERVKSQRLLRYYCITRDFVIESWRVHVNLGRINTMLHNLE